MTGPPFRWKDSDWDRAIELRRTGLTYDQIAARLGMPGKRVQMKFSNEGLKARRATGTVIPHHKEPSVETLAERQRAYDAARSLTATLCGDPPAGRSALDKMRAPR